MNRNDNEQSPIPW